MASTRINPSAAVLWASAFLIAALVIVQAGKLPGNPAYAGMAAEADGVTLVTARTGRGDNARPNEMLWIIDTRDEVVLVYEIEEFRKRQITLLDGGSLREFFTLARR